MEKRPELIVRFNKKDFEFGLLVCFAMILASIFLFLFVERTFLGGIPFIGLGIKIVLGSFVILFSIGLVYGIYLLRSKEPIFVFNEEGAQIKYFGFVRWDEIDEVGIYPCMMGKEHPQTFGLYFKDPRAISRQATWQGKMQLFSSRIFKYPPVLMSNLDVPSDAILRFAEQFAKRSSTDCWR